MTDPGLKCMEGNMDGREERLTGNDWIPAWNAWKAAK
jgi:hypothetical protein